MYLVNKVLNAITFDLQWVVTRQVAVTSNTCRLQGKDIYGKG